METGKFLECALLAGACALPLVAVGAVLLGDDEHYPDHEIDSDDRLPCDGCGELYAPDALVPGALDTRWCSGCVADAGPTEFDCVAEDDGEP